MIRNIISKITMLISIVIEVLLFVLTFPISPPVQPPFVEKVVIPADNFEHDKSLQAKADALLPLFDNMPSVPIFIKEEVIIKTGSNTERGVAYTDCAKHEIPTVFVKKVFYQTANQKQLVNILKHELTHAWTCRQHLMAGHDETFRRKFKEVGGFGN